MFRALEANQRRANARNVNTRISMVDNLPLVINSVDKPNIRFLLPTNAVPQFLKETNAEPNKTEYLILNTCNAHFNMTWWSNAPTMRVYTQRPDHNTGNYVPFSLRTLSGFFNVPQSYIQTRVVRRDLRFIVLIGERARKPNHLQTTTKHHFVEPDSMHT